MNSYKWQFLSFRLRASILSGLLLVVFGGVYFFNVFANVSAQTEAVEKPAGQNLVNGRLAFTRSAVGPGPDRWIQTSNPDGSEATTVPNRSFNDLSSNHSGNFEMSGICQNGKCVGNGKIAFSRNFDIFTINSDGTNWTSIASGPAHDNDPNWSPDGLKIAFSTNRDGNREIYRMNADGSNPVRLTNNAATDYAPYYSPDGLTIVFVSDRDGNDEIYKMNADGSNQIRLTNDAETQRFPAFSPDGQKIVYVSGVQNTSNPLNLFTMNTDGSNRQPIPGPAVQSQQYHRPSYSPDGSKIIFTYSSDFISDPPKTYTMNADGTDRMPFNFGQLGSYSPDGTKVVYTNIFGVAGQIYELLIANSDGSSVQRFAGSQSFMDVADWQPIPLTTRTSLDFDGDGRSDVSVFRPSDGVWHLLRSQTGYTSLQWGFSTDVLTPADYDGDLKTDIAVWRTSNGNFYILNSFNNTVRIENFGLAGDIPTGGDWDGDGKADLAVYRPGAQSVFYYRGSMGNPQGNISSIAWGISDDKPVVGDFDGDGRTDAAVYRSGIWYILNSSSGQLSAYQFGLENDKIIPADYDGDGKTDPAVYRDGIWYLLRSAQGFTAFQFGIANDTPAPADYDGDGRADAAVYRNGVWWILSSQSGAAQAVSFGLGDDAPVSSAFVR